jgi:hypothetical protein
LQGFREMGDLLRQACHRCDNPRQAFEQGADAYLRFAATHPALYQAMFTLPTGLNFGQGDAEPELRTAFQLLQEIVAPYFSDSETAAELLWAALHGLADLDRSERTRASHTKQRVALMIDVMTARRRASS